MFSLISFFISIKTNKFYWLDHTKLWTPIKRVEGLDQNKLPHEALRFNIVELQGVKNFYDLGCACRAVLLHI